MASTGPFQIVSTLLQRGDLQVIAARVSTPAADPVILVTLSAESDTLTDWIAHLKLVQKLHHPHILTFTHGGRLPDGTRYVQVPVYPSLRPGQMANLDALLTLAESIGAALDHAHAQGIAHTLLRRMHVVRLPDGRNALWGFEIAGAAATPAHIRADVIALATLLEPMLPDRGLSASAQRDLQNDLRNTVIQGKQGAFASAGALFQALRAAAMIRQAVPPVPAPSVLTPPDLRSSQDAQQQGGRRTRLALTLIGLLIFAGVFASRFVSGSGGLAAPTMAALEATLQTQTPSAAPSHLPTATDTPSPTPAPTVTATFTATATLTATATPTLTPSTSPTFTWTPSLTLTPSITMTPTSIFLAMTKPCVALVGDSVTHGGVTYEVPGSGYIIALTAPLADFVASALKAQNLGDLEALDRGVSHTGISTRNHPSYFVTGAYSALLNDRCRYTMIMPWLNDITSEILPQAAAERHAAALISMVRQLAGRNPYGRIVLMDYFHGATSPYALRTWAAGFTPENVDLYNQAIHAACDLGPLRIPQVVCIRTNEAFAGLGIDHVIGPIGQDAFMASLVSPLSDQAQFWLDNYFTNNPAGTILGDGVHLSEKGKAALAAYLVRLVQTLPEVTFDANTSAAIRP